MSVSFSVAAAARRQRPATHDDKDPVVHLLKLSNVHVRWCTRIAIDHQVRSGVDHHLLLSLCVTTAGGHQMKCTRVLTVRIRRLHRSPGTDCRVQGNDEAAQRSPTGAANDSRKRHATVNIQ